MWLLILSPAAKTAFPLLSWYTTQFKLNLILNEVLLLLIVELKSAWIGLIYFCFLLSDSFWSSDVDDTGALNRILTLTCG